jgi:RNA polymerase sigma-70 factor (ECF subfamily)
LPLGRIQNRAVCGSRPVSGPPPRIAPEIKRGGENGPRPTGVAPGTDDAEGQIDEYARRLIRHKARQLVDKAGFTKSDVEDLVQELWLDLFQRLPRFDSARSRPRTFVARVVQHKIAAILRHRQAEMRDYRRNGRSLSDTAGEKNGKTISRADILDRHVHDLRTGSATRSPEEHSRLRFDLAGVMDQLPPSLRGLCERLKTSTVSEISRDTGVSRATLHEAIRRLRRRFEDAGLKGYL